MVAPNGCPRERVLGLPGDALPPLGGQRLKTVNAVEAAVWFSATTDSPAASSLVKSFLLYASQSPNSIFAHHLLTTITDQAACPGQSFPMNNFHLGVGEIGECPERERRACSKKVSETTLLSDLLVMPPLGKTNGTILPLLHTAHEAVVAYIIIAYAYLFSFTQTIN